LDVSQRELGSKGLTGVSFGGFWLEGGMGATVSLTVSSAYNLAYGDGDLSEGHLAILKLGEIGFGPRQPAECDNSPQPEPYTKERKPELRIPGCHPRPSPRRQLVVRETDKHRNLF
jgi:hypothetical protein